MEFSRCYFVTENVNLNDKCVCTSCGVWVRVYMYVLGVAYGCSLCMYYVLGVMYVYSLYVYMYI